MALLKRNTSTALERAQQDLAACEVAIAAAQTERQSKLLEADADELARLDVSIIDRQRQGQIFRDKIGQLEARLATEQAADRERKRADAIKAVEALLPRREEAARQFEAAVQAVGKALQQLDAARQQIIANWPAADLQLPYAHYIAHPRALAVAKFVPEFGGYAERIREQHAELMEHLRAQPVQQPEPETEPENEIAA